MPASTKVDIFRNVLDDINDLLLLVEFQSFLREIAEAHGIADVEASAVGLYDAEQHFYERRLASAVVADNAHLLKPREVVIEILQYYGLLLAVMESLRHILALKNLRAYIHVSRFQSQLPFLYSLFSYTLKVVESLLTIACLVPPGLRHAPHPFKLSPVEVVGPGYLGPLVVYSLLAFFQIVAVVAAVGVYRVVVKLQDDVAHAVEEEAVVGDHKQRFVAPVQVALQPFYHFEVEMVGRLIQYQQVRVGDKHICQCHPFLLSSR